jgi:hypothetical protein
LPCRHDEGRVELVQMPTQPLLRPPALVDEILAVVDQQLEITKRPLIRARRLNRGSRKAARATASASIGSDLPRALPARRSGAISFGGTRTRSSPAANGSRSSQCVSCQAPIRSRSAVSGRGRRHNAGKSALGDMQKSSQPPPPESLPLTGRHHDVENDSEFGDDTGRIRTSARVAFRSPLRSDDHSRGSR